LSLSSSFQIKRKKEEGNDNCCHLLHNKTPIEKNDGTLSLSYSSQTKRKRQ